MAALRELFAYLGFGFDDKKLKEADSGVNKLRDGVQAVVAVFASSALVQGVNRFAEQLDVFDDLSAQTKIATDDLQFYGYVARVSGSSAEEMNSALTRLQMGIGKTEKATSPQAKALKDLGIQLEDSAGHTRTLRDVLPEVFANFATLGSEAEKAQVATALFGRAGVRMIPTLDRGAEGLAAMNAEFEKFGGPVSEEAIKAAGEYRDNLVRLDVAWFKLKGLLAGSALPVFSKAAEMIASGVAAIGEWAKNTTLAESAVYALAGTIVASLGAAIAPFLAIIAKAALVYIAFDDLIAFLSGYDSLLGRAIDKVFGGGSADAVRAWVNDAIAQLQLFYGSAQETNKALMNDGASTWTTIAASFAGAWRDMTQGFPVLNAGWNALVENMKLTWLEWTSVFASTWNAIAKGVNWVSEKMGGDKVLDETDRQGDIDAQKARKAQADKALLEVWDRQAAGMSGADVNWRGVTSGDDTRQFAGNQPVAGGAFFAPGQGALAYPGTAPAPFRVTDPAGDVTAIKARIPGTAQTQTVYAPVTTNTYTINAKTNASAAEIAREVKAIQDAQARQAQAALTTRAP